MRLAIRNKLLTEIPELKECYEPTVPGRNTVKPYAVVVQGEDDEQNNPTSFKRTIEIWLYQERTTFINLDSLSEKVIEALDLNIIENKKTKESFTCMFDKTIGQDVIDEEWNAIARGLQFSVIALHNENNITKDTWVEAISKYTESLTGLDVYRNTWKKNFKVPSILWRVSASSRERVNSALYRINKTLRCHVISREKAEIENILDIIENKLILDLKISLDINKRRYLAIASITEDREADMFAVGQLSIQFTRLEMIEDNTQTIDKIYGHGSLK